MRLKAKKKTLRQGTRQRRVDHIGSRFSVLIFVMTKKQPPAVMYIVGE